MTLCTKRQAGVLLEKKTNFRAFCNKNFYTDKIRCFLLNCEINYGKLFLQN